MGQINPFATHPPKKACTLSTYPQSTSTWFTTSSRMSGNCWCSRWTRLQNGAGPWEGEAAAAGGETTSTDCMLFTVPDGGGRGFPEFAAAQGTRGCNIHAQRTSQ